MNELSTWGGDEATAWYRAGLDSLVHRVESVRTETLPDGRYRVRVEIESRPFLTARMAARQALAYTVRGDGMIELDHDVSTYIDFPHSGISGDSPLPWLPKLGLLMRLGPAMQRLEWYGRGPFETYPDRKTGARVGRWSIPFSDIVMPYLIPQDFGNRTDVLWAAVTNAEGVGMAVSVSEPFDVAVNPYWNLMDAWYPFGLQRTDRPYFSVDYRVTGVGGTPITVRGPYRTYPDRYRRRVLLRPIDLRRDDPFSMPLPGLE